MYIKKYVPIITSRTPIPSVVKLELEIKRNTEKYPYPILIKESNDNKIEDFGSGFGFSSARISSTSSVILPF